MREARRSGWQLALMITSKLQAGDLKEYPGIEAWLKDFNQLSATIDPKLDPEQWPPLKVDELVTNNPNFWRAYYEIAPGDPGVMLLHAGLLLASGEGNRASNLMVVAWQRPRIPKEVRRGFEIVLAHSHKLSEKSNAVVREGLTLHDKGEHAAAVKKYQAALAIWPQNGLAHYELGLTLRQQEWVAAGEKLPKPGSVAVNSKLKHSAEVDVCFAQSRRHDPFQINAYQGDNKEVIAGFMSLSKSGMPAWQKLTKNRAEQQPDDVLKQLAASCQEAGIHDLALAIRQMVVARRNTFRPEDHPFITVSLNKLAPGETTDITLKRLAGGTLSLRQLIAPDPE
jgi:hypothetical protein